MGATDDASLHHRALRRIRQNGVVNFIFAAVAYALPEPYSTRFYVRYEIFSDIVTAAPTTSNSFTDLIRGFRYGFTPELYSLYRLDDGRDPAMYLDEISRRHARRINDEPSLLDNKKRFYTHLQNEGFDEYLPDVYGYIDDGTLISDQYSSIRDIVLEQERVVIKRYTGSCGHHVYICIADDEQIRLHTKGRQTYTLDEKIDEFENHLITEYCEQAEFLESIYPGAANTVRIVTLRTSDGIIIAAAALRIGSLRTGVLDNFSQGGMSAMIDIETGELSEAAEPTEGRDPRWHERHPDTEARIAGVTVAGWKTIRDQIRTVAAELKTFDYVGWDLVITAPGEFKIIEANSFPDPDVIQVHGPLLDDDDVRQFFEDHEVIPRRR
ncbi:sugar-transfer associated ATP-grasp domain-containing protein [Natronomonas sp.]|uniref:sugar-transfer associated ATP-grasp domain-containing protein n=1 Tax=Natronomonas sp. TaxID=2184060 RepID=UPI002FC2FBF0